MASAIQSRIQATHGCTKLPVDQTPFLPHIPLRYSRNHIASEAAPAVSLRWSSSSCGLRQRICAHANSSSAQPGELDVQALIKYPSAIALQLGIMTLALAGLQQLGDAVAAADTLAGGLTGADAQRYLVTAFFLVTSIRSRIFSPLDASRPTLGKGQKGFSTDDPVRPSWMPPAITFPIVWSTIGLLRCTAAVMIWEASGRDLLVTPLIVYCAHLAIGDCWNHINVVERRLGVAVPGVAMCALSAYAVTAAYYSVDHTAGYVIAPSAVWISIASAIVFGTWQLNGQPPLYPAVGDGRPVGK